MLWPYCHKAVVIGLFYADRQFIAENLCVNKDKPQLHCNGQCVLYKRLKFEQEKQGRQAVKILQFRFFDFSIAQPVTEASLAFTKPYYNFFDLKELTLPGFLKKTPKPPEYLFGL